METSLEFISKLAPCCRKIFSRRNTYISICKGFFEYVELSELPEKFMFVKCKKGLRTLVLMKDWPSIPRISCPHHALCLLFWLKIKRR